MSANFSSERIAPDTWVIRGPGCDAYLLRGDNSGIMIDAGMSVFDIRAYAEEVAQVPVNCVVDTHGHFDHTGGNGFFDTVYATEGISRNAKNTMGADPAAYPMGYRFTFVGDGASIDIGGRPLTIVELDCHSPGNVAVIDHRERLLFPGDELETGQVLLLPGYAEKPGELHARPASTVESYLRAMKKLSALGDHFDSICPAHNGTPISKEYLARYITLAQRILDGHEGSRDCSGSGYNATMNHFPLDNANYRRAQWDGASLVYCADRVFDADIGTQSEPATKLHRLSSHSIYS